MYSMVLMMALGSSPAPPVYQPEVGADHNQARYGNHLKTEQQRFFGGRRGGCHGCYGCYGGCYGGYGGCYGGYGCRGYWGGCRGYWGGCYGGCHGCWGGYAPVYYGGCSGCSGCYGGGYGAYYGGWASMPYSGSSYYGGTDYGSVAQPMPIDNSYRQDYDGRYDNRDRGDRDRDRGDQERGRQSDRERDRDRGDRDRESRDDSQAEASATFVVSLPAGARLTVNGTPTRSTSATRTFVSPPLPAGKVYSYRLKAEIMRDGQAVTASRRITVRPGEATHVTLDFPDRTLTRK